LYSVILNTIFFTSRTVLIRLAMQDFARSYKLMLLSDLEE